MPFCPHLMFGIRVILPFCSISHSIRSLPALLRQPCCVQLARLLFRICWCEARHVCILTLPASSIFVFAEVRNLCNFVSRARADQASKFLTFNLHYYGRNHLGTHLCWCCQCLSDPADSRESRSILSLLHMQNTLLNGRQISCFVMGWCKKNFAVVTRALVNTV